MNQLLFSYQKLLSAAEFPEDSHLHFASGPWITGLSSSSRHTRDQTSAQQIHMPNLSCIKNTAGGGAWKQKDILENAVKRTG